MKLNEICICIDPPSGVFARASYWAYWTLGFVIGFSEAKNPLSRGLMRLIPNRLRDVASGGAAADGYDTGVQIGLPRDNYSTPAEH